MFSVLGPGTATAVCDCTGKTVSDSLAEQGIVFVGEMSPTVEVVDPLAVYTFTVSGIYKGEASLETKVGTLLSADDCGLGADAPAGRWLVFASRFPDETGPLLMNACSASGPLAADQAIPAELGEARLPPELIPPPEAVIVTVPPPRIVWTGLPDWRPPALTALLAFAAVGFVARILAGRRRRTVV